MILIPQNIVDILNLTYLEPNVPDVDVTTETGLLLAGSIDVIQTQL